MPVPLRVLALFIVVSALVLTTLATALADSHPAAADGQRLEDQSAEVQALYRAVYGDDAEARWIAEHNAAIGMSMMDDMMMDDMAMDDMSNMYYDRIVAVAMARGADAELANRIAADVISRGTEAEFLAGTDAGVLYGIGESEDSINAAPAPSAPSAPAPAPAAAPAAAADDWDNISLYFSLGQSISLTLPDSDHASAKSYLLTESGLDGIGLTYADAWDRETRVLSGVVTTVGTYTGTYSAKSSDDATGDDIGEPYVLTVTLVVRNADTQPQFAANAEIAAITHTQGDTTDTVSPAFPDVLTGTGNAPVTYSLDGDLPVGVTYDDSAKTVTVTSAAEAGSTSVTYVAKDQDGDTVSLPVSITVNEDLKPEAPDVADFSIKNGADIGRFLPEGSGGNGTLTYTLALASGEALSTIGVSFVAGTRWFHGPVTVTLPAGVDEQSFGFVYTVTDSDAATASPDSDQDTFTVTVTRE